MLSAALMSNLKNPSAQKKYQLPFNAKNVNSSVLSSKEPYFSALVALKMEIIEVTTLESLKIYRLSVAVVKENKMEVILPAKITIESKIINLSRVKKLKLLSRKCSSFYGYS